MKTRTAKTPAKKPSGNKTRKRVTRSANSQPTRATAPPPFGTHLRLDSIDPDPGQPRKHFDRDALQALADDIAARGVLQPITVRIAGDERYTLISGERRWRAAKLAGRTDIPAVISDRHFASNTNSLEVLFDQVAENLSRADLNPIEMADFLRRLRDEHGVKVGAIPDLCAEHGLKAMSRSYVSNTIRLTELPQWARDLIGTGKLTAHHGRELLPVCDLKPVMADVRAALEHTPDITVEALLEHINDAMSKHYVWADRRWGDDVVLYDARKAAAKDGALDLRKVAGDTYICNLALHEKLQADARAKAKQRAARAAAKDADTKAKSDAAAAPLNPIKVRDYLHTWLAEHIASGFERIDPLDQGSPAVVDRLIEWALIGMPDNQNASYWTFEPGQRYACIDHIAAHRMRPALHELAHRRFYSAAPTLTKVLAGEYRDTHPSDPEIAAQIVRGLDTRHLGCLARHMQFALADEWRIDAGYCALLRKAQMEQIAARAFPCGTPDYHVAHKKASTLREYLIAHAEEIHRACGVQQPILDAWSGYEFSDEERQDADDDWEPGADPDLVDSDCNNASDDQDLDDAA